MLVGTYSGKGGSYLDPKIRRLTGAAREEIKHRFLRGEIDVLVCTDAAAEGLNLQSADLLINFDLPWNPMKVEQRIGRIDRIGQRHATIYVGNLCYLGSAEEIVYGRLLHRLTQAGHVVGTQQLSLLPVTQEEFRQLAEGELTESQLTHTALERAQLQRRRTQSMEIPARELYDMYVRLAEQAKQKPPVDLDAIWHAFSHSGYLRQLGCTQQPDAWQRVIEL
jgi:superfamily II DNA/RNA helicase